MSQETIPLTRSPAASSWDLQKKLSFPSFPLHIHPWEFHRQSLAGDFVGDMGSHTDSAIALWEIDESFQRLTNIKTCCHQYCQQGWHETQEVLCAEEEYLYLIPSYYISLYDFSFPETTCNWGKVSTLSIVYYYFLHFSNVFVITYIA